MIRGQFFVKRVALIYKKRSSSYLQKRGMKRLILLFWFILLFLYSCQSKKETALFTSNRTATTHPGHDAYTGWTPFPYS